MTTPEYLTREYYRDRRPPARTWPDVDPLCEVRSTDPRPAGAPPEPSAVVKLVAAAERNGFTVRVGYGRGPARSVRIGSYRMVESFGLWSAPHPVTGWRFRAVYSHTHRTKGGWSWDIALWRPPRMVRFLDATITDLHEWLLASGEVGKPWYKAVSARVADQAERQRVNARTRTTKPKEGSA